MYVVYQCKLCGESFKSHIWARAITLRNHFREKHPAEWAECQKAFRRFKAVCDKYGLSKRPF